MQPIILTILVITKDHVDKTVMLPGKSTYIKGVNNKLLGWLLAVASRSESLAAPGSVVEMIRNWNDKKNNIFDFRVNSRMATHFKASKHGQWIRNLPKFSNLSRDDNCSNLTNSLFTYSPMGLVLYIIKKAVNSSDINDLLL